MLIRHRLTAAFLWLAVGLFAQNNSVLPPGLTPQYSALFSQNNSVLPILLKQPDLAQIKAEDDQQDQQARFAAPISTQINTKNAGTWTPLPDSSQVWQCHIKAPNALALILLFQQVVLPEGGKLYAYDLAHTRIRGPITREQIGATGRFTIGTLPSDEVVLEYHAPAYTKGTEIILLNRVDYAYNLALLAEEDPFAASGFGGSLSCNVNVNCPSGSNWQTEKKGVARILMIFSGGSAWCSGTLIANTGNTGIPYFLTAHHCQILLSNPQFDQWSFDFNYEFASCTTGPEPAYQTVVGCTRMSFRLETDFLLLRLNPVPTNFNTYFNGWTRSTTPATTAAFIHHPQGDVKKFSMDNGAAVSHNQTINWGGAFGVSPINTHWKVTPDVGIYEPGSSGCPMFDQSKKVVGQLHGGVSNGCNVTAAYFGMLHLSWDGTSPTNRLKDYLDPANTNVTEMNGYAQPAAPVGISGNIKSWWGVNMPNVRVAISGVLADTVTTDGQGNYAFQSLAPGANYVVTPLTKGSPLNGVDAYDLILISRHILNLEPLTPAWKIIAGDVNESGSLTTFDNVESRKVILGTLPSFASQRAWRYFAADAVFTNPDNPFANMPASSATFTNLAQSVTGVNFFGVKVGDVDKSGNPGQ